MEKVLIVVIAAVGAGVISHSVLEQMAGSAAYESSTQNLDRVIAGGRNVAYVAPWYLASPALMGIGVALVVLVIGLLIVIAAK